ncbi:MAG: hypothetical protein COV74_08160 [Candidatus Omnitrophica bacterium CG11_big_fil_rev_8_21_14_0_20_45_26]|uniref:Uncharacterized protein n=1 Tax=Candidatus Abzuiibacterium crystallinum TaxID=1974748 RepID=A0A2H0LM01_9BACT|nr:MAG: hypothetical protein COV74_08160 [Candidatus Omnitrophica bacterium CG11_big_fil_rev_8_21_14_0_20_45_26]PIW64021.1 MAG: hypothetical protein COW12_07880 [Candidatus Omnitrophica bacterium CG12_big_fil_rev_8_21_14_0_65_45_16]
MIFKKNIEFETAFFEAIVKDRPQYVDALIPLAEAYTRQGLHDKGLTIDKRLAKLRKEDPIVHYNLACSYALTGRKKEALSALSRSIRLGYRDFNHIRSDKDLKILHNEPRFKKLVSN